MTIAPKLKLIEPVQKHFRTSTLRGECSGREAMIRHAIDCEFAGTCIVDYRAQYAELHQVEKSLLLLRGQAVDYASDVEDLLKRFLASYYCQNYSELENLVLLLNKDETIKSVGKLTFMECRKAISSLLKNDKSLGQKNGFTSLLNSIILDRNKYAHGRFFFGVPSQKSMLHWLESGSPPPIERFAEIDASQIENYIDCCLATYDWLDTIKKAFEKKSGEASG